MEDTYPNDSLIDDELEIIGESVNIISSAKKDGVKSGAELEKYVQEIAANVKENLSQSISVLTPWFFNNMPQIYYQATPRSEKIRHLSSIITGHVFESKQTIELWDRDKRKVTYLGPGDDGDILLEMAHKVKNIDFKSATLYFSKDRMLFLSSFFTSDYKELDLENPRISEKISAVKKSLLLEFPDDEKDIEKYLSKLDNEFVIYATDARIHITYRMYRYMINHEGAHTMSAPFEGSDKVRFTLGFKHEKAADFLEEILSLIHKYGYQVSRGTIISFKREKNNPITVMHFSIADKSGNKIDTQSVQMIRLHKALRTLAWVDVDEYSILTRAPHNQSINSANLLRSIAAWCYVSLGKDNIYYYSNYKIFRTLLKFDDLRNRLIDLFRLKFDPIERSKKKNINLAELMGKYETDIQNTLMDDVERDIFVESMLFIKSVLKTNYFMQTKTGLAFRLDPNILDSKYYEQVPYGIFFVVGRDYRMFHVRWKDISRGGVRVVMPKSTNDYEASLLGMFDEVYGLSYAQQLKNKDIPEGGSKAVLLLKPGGKKDKAVKGAVNAMLDILLTADEAKESKAGQIISYFDQEEIIYLGPDENITNNLIEWIPQQAKRRGYKYAEAFMSSKPGAGINHKEYGVTSEGVNVFVDNLLRFLQIHPDKKPFTVKITGGPDGDVAGNALKILHREYGESAKIVAIADGYGAAYNPEGLSWKELLRLVDEGHPITHFDKTKLSGDDSFIIAADNSENIKVRNELHYKVDADIFIPAGGRPYTVNEKTCSMFIVDGNPTCRGIVEGANIFFTSEAREFLQDAGVFIIKDSSANKTGVICSSYEIIASLTISQKEFLEIKKEYVDQVIIKLREKADLEAKTLLKEYSVSNGEKNLVALSLELSKEINSITDSLLDQLTEKWTVFSKDPLCKKIIFRHCPDILVQKYKSRIIEKLPEAHKIAIVSSFIASYIVYREGLNWMMSEPAAECYERCLYYMRQDQLTDILLDQVDKSDLEEKDKIKKILAMSAARNLTEIDEFSS